MRLFIGIDTGPAVAEGAAPLLDQLRRRVRDAAPAARVTWIPPERLHLTVRFIGDVDEPSWRSIDDALSLPLAAAAFDVEVRGVGTFPSHGRPRVIWGGVTAGRDAVISIEREIAARVNPLIGSGDERPFSPHLTLARIRDAAGLTRRIGTGLEDALFGTTRIETVTLFESRLSPKGPTYVPLRQIRLGDEAPGTQRRAPLR